MDNDTEADLVDEDEFDVALSLDPDVQAVLDELVPSDDPLDKIDFNEIEYINQLFPTEQSLANLDDVIVNVQSKMHELDSEIRSVLHSQNDASLEAKQVLDDAQSVVGQLFARMNEIREKADRSENAVREITSDIRQLDNAKRNLTSSITTLNQLYMLVGEFELLEKLTRKRQYGEVAIHLAGAHDVLGNLERFMHIPYVSELVQRISVIEAELQSQIFAEFRDAFEFQRGAKSQAGGKSSQQAVLFCACRVIDLLPKGAKTELISWFVKLQLAEYGVLFNESQDEAWLDKIDRRFTFCKKLLKDVDEKFAEVFPSEWEVCESIAAEFCEITRRELARIMQKRAADIDVKLLLFAIQKTTAFEALMAKIFTGATFRQATDTKITATTAAAAANADRKRTLSQSKASPKNPFENESPKKNSFAQAAGGSKNPFEIDADADLTAGSGGAEPVDGGDARKAGDANGGRIPSPFLGLISRCFEPHLGIYIDAQEKNLTDLIVRFATEFQQPTNSQNNSGSTPFSEPEGSSNKVHPSCADLFMFFKKALLQLSAISNGDAMLQLLRVFQKAIREYATRVLLGGLPLRRPTAGASNLVDESSRVLQKFTTALLSSSFVQSNLRELNIQVGTLANAGSAEQPSAAAAAAAAQQTADAAISDLTPFLPAGKLNEEETARVCCVICTAEYCYETVAQLESKLRERTDARLRDRITFAAESELLQKVISACIQILVHDLEGCCEPALSAMSKSAWSTVDSVGDQSNYVSVISSHLRTNLVTIRENLALSRKYFTQFCLKFAGSFVNRFIQSLFKCKPISLVGAEQLLLDTHSLKTVLMDLPSVGSAITLRKPPSSYTKVVHQLMTKAEMILKSVMAPLTPPQTYVADFVKLLPDSDLAEFTKVLEMKGVTKKQEQAVYIDLFRAFQQAGANQQKLLASQSAAAAAGESSASVQGQSANARAEAATLPRNETSASQQQRSAAQQQANSRLSQLDVSGVGEKEDSSSRISIKNLEKLIKRK